VTGVMELYLTPGVQFLPTLNPVVPDEVVVGPQVVHVGLPTSAFTTGEPLTVTPAELTVAESNGQAGSNRDSGDSLLDSAESLSSHVGVRLLAAPDGSGKSGQNASLAGALAAAPSSVASFTLMRREGSDPALALAMRSGVTLPMVTAATPAALSFA